MTGPGTGPGGSGRARVTVPVHYNGLWTDDGSGNGTRNGQPMGIGHSDGLRTGDGSGNRTGMAG